MPQPPNLEGHFLSSTPNSNRPNPFQAPTPVDDPLLDSLLDLLHGKLVQRKIISWWMIVVLAPVASWAIYWVSPIGIFLPGAIGVAVSLHVSLSFRTTLACISLAYVLGIAAIICADGITTGYDSLILMDDALRLKVTRVWAGFGILGAIGGAILGAWLSVSIPAQT